MISYTKTKTEFKIKEKEWMKFWNSIEDCTWGKAMEEFSNKIESQYVIFNGRYDVTQKMTILSYSVDDEYVDFPALECINCSLNVTKGGKKLGNSTSYYRILQM